MRMALTAKQQRFVSEFLLDLNGTQAAIRAGYSPRSAQEQASQMLARADIKAAVDAAKLKRSAELEIDAAWVLKRLAVEAEADLADIFNDNGDLKQVEEWPLIWRQGLVAGVEIEALFEGMGEDRIQIGHVKKIRLSDRLRRLELIGKHVCVNAFQETVSVGSLEGLAERLARANEIAADWSKTIDHDASEVTDVAADDRDDEQRDEAAEPTRPHAFVPLPKPDPKPPEPPPKPEPYRPIVPTHAPWPSSFTPAKNDYDPLTD